jgi:hypothetical protein
MNDSPADPLLLNPNDWYFQHKIRICPFCLLWTQHAHVFRNDTTTTPA